MPGTGLLTELLTGMRLPADTAWLLGRDQWVAVAAVRRGNRRHGCAVSPPNRDLGRRARPLAAASDPWDLRQTQSRIAPRVVLRGEHSGP